MIRVDPRSGPSAKTGRAVLAGGLISLAAACVLETPVESFTDRAPVTSTGISPPTGTVLAGSGLQFTATVMGDGTVPQGVTWSLVPDEWAYIGRLDQTGFYHVDWPMNADSDQLVVATSVADPSKSAQAIVHVPAFSIAIAPSSAILTLGDFLQFSATVKGQVASKIAWEAGCGTVDANGKYQAPADPLCPPFNDGYDRVSVSTVLPSSPASSLLNGGARAIVQLNLRPPVLTGTSGPVRPLGTLIVYGSGFMASAGISHEVLFEDTSGKFWGSYTYGVADDHAYAQVGSGPAYSGRLSLQIWTVNYQTALSNIFDAGVAP